MPWTLDPWIEKLGRRLLPSRSIPDVAHRAWRIHPGDRFPARQAVFLPGQLERVTGWKFSAHDPRVDMNDGWEHETTPTRAYMLRDAVLVEGSFYKGRAKRFIHASPWLPRFWIDEELDRAGAFCSYNGHKWFANWLIEDCTTYPLALEHGTPVTTRRAPELAMAEYEQCFGMESRRLDRARFRELVVFDDESRNLGWKGRFEALRAKLRARFPPRASNPGVFVLRGSQGEPRSLTGELELAQHLRDTRGFQIVAPEEESLNEVASKCSGARVVVGMEGSQLFNGILQLAEEGAVLAIQPADRFVAMIKHMLDRQEQTFGLVIARKTETGYVCDRDELDRTLDLLLAACDTRLRAGTARNALGA